MATANTKRTNSGDPLDLYNTERKAVEAAIVGGVFGNDSALWDPCDGLGDLSQPLIDHGFDVWRSDIEPRGRDILQLDFMAANITASERPIVMNPPFKLTPEFIDKGLSVRPRLYMFNRTSVLETNKRAANFTSGRWPLKYYYQFAFRVGCSKGESREPLAKAVMYAWYVFDKEYKGEPILRWLIDGKA